MGNFTLNGTDRRQIVIFALLAIVSIAIAYSLGTILQVSPVCRTGIFRYEFRLRFCACAKISERNAESAMWQGADSSLSRLPNMALHEFRHPFLVAREAEHVLMSGPGDHP